jgi:hypothetical protein
MVISTRTPEGEPLKCGVCGREHLVLSSWPPGDSVCPTCGSHAWLVPRENEEQFPTPNVLQFVPAFVDRLRLSCTRVEMATCLVNGLFECLSPHGVMLWIPSPTNGTHFDLVASNGEIHSKEFAIAVAEERQEIMRVKNTNFGDRLLIGVPLQAKNDAAVAGILEVAQRTKTLPDTRDGFLRFVRTMAAVTTGCRAFAQNKIEQ